MKGWKQLSFHLDINSKRAEVVILVSDKNRLVQNLAWYCILVKGSVHQEDLMIRKMDQHALIRRAPVVVKQASELKGDIVPKQIVKDSNSNVLMYEAIGGNISIEREDLNGATN